MNDRDIWAVGAGGSIFHGDGVQWTAVLSNTTNDLRSIWASAPNDVWVAGGRESGTPEGVVVRWDGSVWTVVLATSHPYRAIWGSSASDVWAVSIDGTVSHWDGIAWGDLPPVNARLHSTWGLDGQRIWVGDEVGVLRHLVGTNWVPEAVPTIQSTDEIDVLLGDANENLYIGGGSPPSLFDWITGPTTWGSSGSPGGPIVGATTDNFDDFWVVTSHGDILHDGRIVNIPDPGGRSFSGVQFTAIDKRDCWYWITSEQGEIWRMGL